MNTFLQTLRNLGPVRLAAIGGIALVVLAFFVFITIRMSTPDYALLYKDLNEQDAGQIVEQLTAQKIAYELRADGKEIWIIKDQIPKVRIDLATAGLPRGGSIGYELFDKGESFGATSFLQNVNNLRALEGELARTINAIEGIKQTRVHLVLPRRELFSRTEQEPSASVFLQLRSADALGREQVAAIQQLVATAVPKLKASNVSVVDGAGNLLARGGDDAQSLMNANSEEMRLRYEQKLARTVEDLLQRTVGYGKVRAEVSVEMDFDRVETSSESFDPEQQVVRSTQTVNEGNESSEAEPVDSISVGNQLPTSNTAAGSPLTPTARTKQNRQEETINYEIGRTVRSQVRQTGTVKRLSVAVLLDGLYTASPQGEQVYTPRSTEEMDRLAALVRSAVGYNADRGDSVEVQTMRFADSFAQLADEGPKLFGMARDDMFRLLEIITLGIVAILVILLVVRPLLAKAFETVEQTDEDAEFLVEGPDGLPALPAAGGALAQALAIEGMDEDEISDGDQMIDINRIEGKVRASTLRKIGDIVNKHPEEAVAILRSWMYQET
jgi:flagellar M-ring protein FliF